MAPLDLPAELENHVDRHHHYHHLRQDWKRSLGNLYVHVVCLFSFLTSVVCYCGSFTPNFAGMMSEEGRS